MNDTEFLPMAAASFAARAHRHGLRKDGVTPYVAHPFRVALVVRHVFGTDDPRVIAAALLHDTIEDTTTDFDDLADEFGAEIAGWVAALSKDMRLPDDERERDYCRVLAAAAWPVIVCKLADIFDNLSDRSTMTAEAQARTVARSRVYLTALSTALPPEAVRAWELTNAKCESARGDGAPRLS